MRIGTSGWTDERVALLKELWATGMSAPEVARRIGGFSRCAIIGKVHRLGLSGRERPTIPRSKPRAPHGGAAGLAKAKAAKPVEVFERKPRPAQTVSTVRMLPMPPAPVSKPIDATKAKVWTERRFGECAYPVGGEGADTLSCCLPSDGASYCARHWKIMHAPSKANDGLKKACLVRNLRRAA